MEDESLKVARSAGGRSRRFRTVPDYDVINNGSVEAGSGVLCTKRFNTEVAESDGRERFEHAELTLVELTDCDGEAHLFHFQTRLFGPGVCVDAFEVRNALSTKHILNSEHGMQIADMVVRARI